MNNIAIIVPIYPPHYGYAKNLINTYIQYHFDKQSDLYFVFSNKLESKLFGKWEHKIIVGDELIKPAILREGVINLKKFYALNELKHLYNYTIILDSESTFCKEVHLYDICEEYFKNKILYGNKTRKNVNKIIESCVSRFNKPMTNDIKNLYLRFNQLCIYKNDTLEDFFQKTGVIEKINDLRFEDFDYYIYMLYLLYFKEFKIQDIGCLADYGFCETGLGEIEVKNMDYKKITFHASTKYMENKFKLTPFIHIQIDREIIGKKYSLKNIFKSIYNKILKYLSKIGIKR